MHGTETAKVYMVTRHGQPVRVRDECKEEQPEHADMLRYDLAFCNPTIPYLVILPVFTSKHGNTSKAITLGRWQSFGMKLHLLGQRSEEQFDVMNTNLDQWTTYVHPRNDSGMVDYTRLAARTLAEHMAQEKVRLKGWR